MKTHKPMPNVESTAASKCTAMPNLKSVDCKKLIKKDIPDLSMQNCKSEVLNKKQKIESNQNCKKTDEKSIANVKIIGNSELAKISKNAKNLNPGSDLIGVCKKGNLVNEPNGTTKK